MNIAFLTTFQVIPNKGGISRITHTLGNYLRENGNCVTFLYLADGEKEERLAGDCNRNHVKNEIRSFLCNSHNISDVVNRCNADVIINQSALNRSSLSLLIQCKKKNPRLRIVSVLHMNLLDKIDNLSYLYANKLKFFSYVFRCRCIVRFLKKYYVFKHRGYFLNLLNVSDKIVVLSPALVDEFKEMTGIDSAKIVSIPNCCDYVYVDPETMEKENAVLWVGRIDEGKKLDVLLRIWKKLQIDFPNWRLDVLGDGPSKNFCMKLSEKLNLKNVVFHGNVENADDFYKKAKIFSFTSGNEGFGLVLLEAAMYSCVRILFDSFPAARNIITDRKTGFLVKKFETREYKDTMASLMCNDKLVEYIGKCSQKDSYRFSADIVGDKWIKLLNETYKR